MDNVPHSKLNKGRTAGRMRLSQGLLGATTCLSRLSHSHCPAWGWQATAVEGGISRAEGLPEVPRLSVSWCLHPLPTVPDSQRLASNLHGAADADPQCSSHLKLCLQVCLVCWAVDAPQHLCGCRQGYGCLLRTVGMRCAPALVGLGCKHGLRKWR